MGLLWLERGLAPVLDPRSTCISAIAHFSTGEQGTSAASSTGSTVLEMYPSSCCARDLAAAGSGLEMVLIVEPGGTSWVLSCSRSQSRAAGDGWEVKEPGGLQQR